MYSSTVLARWWSFMNFSTIEVSHTLLPSLGSLTCRIYTLSEALCLVLFEVGVVALDCFEVLLGAQLDGVGVLGPSLP